MPVSACSFTGAYIIPARDEWIRSAGEITKEDYMKYFGRLFGEEF